MKKIYHYGDDANPKVLFVFFVNSFKGNISLSPKTDQLSRNENIIDTKWFSEKEIKSLTESDFMAPYAYLVSRNLDKDTDEIEILKI